MEEARSLEPRRVTIEFCPQRMADAILSLAFERLVASTETNSMRDCSVQNNEDADAFEASLSEEACQ